MMNPQGSLPQASKGPCSGGAGFLRKIPERSEDDFSAKPEGPGLAVRKEAFANFAL